MAGFGDLLGGLGDLIGGLVDGAVDTGSEGVAEMALGALFGGDRDEDERPRSVQTDTYDRRLAGARRVLNVNDM
ncbi:MAG TPA: hypothetical protein VHT05_04110 [Candidatus Elarobacter sp.]|nr:hypothetical protein [Candidatus Elarobacter sp.]